MRHSDLSPTVSRFVFGMTIFWSAMLLLMIQPILTKALLPWFGGSAGVWTTSMLFYQFFLLLGYLYAHLVSRHLPLRAQAGVHVALLCVTLLCIPVSPDSDWKPQPQDDPLTKILGLLLTGIGLPYFVLSSTSPLLQSWFAASSRVELPYRLFAVSNFGSLVALLGYPAIVEPLLPTRKQLLVWSIGYGVFVLLVTIAALNVSRIRTVPLVPQISKAKDIWTWLALASCPSILWIATANHLSQDVAAVPFLWVLPLSIYLLTFVLCFDRERWYRRKVLGWLLPVSWAAICFGVGQSGFLNIKYAVAIFTAALFVCCMFCHGELARLKPGAGELTTYYLIIAAGGALGGLFVGLIAPKLFNEYLEFPIALLLCVILALWLLYRFPVKRVLRFGLVAGAAVIAALTIRSEEVDTSVHIRNFYGTLQASESGSIDARYRSLYNGTIQHGVQFLSPNLRRVPITYYGPASGVYIALQALRAKQMRVGIVGLGVGTLAAYAQPGDVYRFYEINPAVIDVANVHFAYLKESAAKIEVVPGDARLSLEREPPQNYDLLVLDAFSGDSIPVHLLTREAFELYFRNVREGGAVVVHVTNKHLDLSPVVQAAANVLNARAFLVHNSSEDERKIYSSSWMTVTRNRELYPRFEYLSSPVRAKPILWTDDFSNLLGVLK